MTRVLVTLSLVNVLAMGLGVGFRIDYVVLGSAALQLVVLILHTALRGKPHD